MVISHLAVRKGSSCHPPGGSCRARGLTVGFGPSRLVSSRHSGHSSGCPPGVAGRDLRSWWPSYRVTHQERWRPLLVLQWVPVRKTGEKNPWRCLLCPSKSTLREEDTAKAVDSETRQVPEKHDPTTHLTPEDMLGVSWSGGPRCPHLPFLATGSPSQCSVAPPAFPPSPCPMQAPGQPQRGGGKCLGLPSLSPGAVPSARDAACLLPPLPVRGVR